MRPFALYNDRVRCLSCQYDLRDLPENRCPECGREFDPSDPTTFGPLHPVRAMTWWGFCLTSALICAVIIFAPYVVWSLVSRRDWHATFPYAILGTAVLTAVAWAFGLLGLLVHGVVRILGAKNQRP
jgi:hypothetical protein